MARALKADTHFTNEEVQLLVARQLVILKSVLLPFLTCQFKSADQNVNFKAPKQCVRNRDSSVRSVFDLLRMPNVVANVRPSIVYAQSPVPLMVCRAVAIENLHRQMTGSSVAWGTETAGVVSALGVTRERNVLHFPGSGTLAS
jgi:hypothetical protein